MASGDVSNWQGDLQIAYSFLVRKDFSHAEKELQQVEAFPVGTMEGPFVSATPMQANYMGNIKCCIYIIIWHRYRANNSMQWVCAHSNQPPNLSARRPEMTCPLPSKISHIEVGMGHAKPSGSSIHHFVFFFDIHVDSTHFLIGCCPHWQPSNKVH